MRVVRARPAGGARRACRPGLRETYMTRSTARSRKARQRTADRRDRQGSATTPLWHAVLCSAAASATAAVVAGLLGALK